MNDWNVWRMGRNVATMCIAVGSSLAATVAVAQGTLKERVDRMLPSVEENKWLEIDWQTDLLKARQNANDQRKPMFMWMMNGHPMGAT